MDFADACLVRMAELNSTARVWTVDSDFSRLSLPWPPADPSDYTDEEELISLAECAGPDDIPADCFKIVLHSAPWPPATH